MKQHDLASTISRFVINKNELFEIAKNIKSIANLITIIDCIHFGLNTYKQKTVLEIDSVVDYLHEELNTGHWSDVPISIRQCFTIASFIKCLILLKVADKFDINLLQTALKSIDLGLLLGAPLNLNEELLTDTAKYLALEIDELRSDSSTSNIKIGNEPLDMSVYKNLIAKEIPIVNIPSLEQFNESYFIPQIPVKLKGCMDQWPACKRWLNVNYLLKIAGDRTVPIEIGSHYLDENWSQKLMTLKDFISKHYLSKDGDIGYLAQHNLFDQITELKEDILIPAYCALTLESENSTEPDVNAWLGPKGTVSPLHFDPKNNLLCQVYGTKQIILFSPEDSEYLYPHKGNFVSNSARVNPIDPDYNTFKKFSKATPFKCLLEPGEMLFIPIKWWHHVTALEKSFSVSFWWM